MNLTHPHNQYDPICAVCHLTVTEDAPPKRGTKTFHVPCLAFQQGYVAFTQKRPFSSNPYGAEKQRGKTEAYDAWIEGFTASEEIQAARDYDATVASIRESWH